MPCQTASKPQFSCLPLPVKTQEEDTTIFNCSSHSIESSSYFAFIPCLSIHGNLVYAVDSFTYVRYLDLTSCRRLYNFSVPYHDRGWVWGYIYTLDGSAFSLKWSKSICGSCHGGGNICRLKIKSNSSEAQTECVKSRGIRISICVFYFPINLMFFFIIFHVLLISSTDFGTKKNK